jgi:hypothetical protein
MFNGKAHLRARTLPVHLAVLIAISLAVPSLARAAEPPVVIGEVGTRVSRAGVDLRRVVLYALQRELAQLALETRGKKYVLSASLVRLDGGKDAAPNRIECTISVVLREAKSGAIRAIVEGKGRAEGEPGSGIELAIVEAAVHAAMSGVPDAVR